MEYLTEVFIMRISDIDFVCNTKGVEIFYFEKDNNRGINNLSNIMLPPERKDLFFELLNCESMTVKTASYGDNQTEEYCFLMNDDCTRAIVLKYEKNDDKNYLIELHQKDFISIFYVRDTYFNKKVDVLC